MADVLATRDDVAIALRNSKRVQFEVNGKKYEVNDFALPEMLPEVRRIHERLEQHFSSGLARSKHQENFIRESLEAAQRAIAQDYVTYQEFLDLNLRLSVISSLKDSIGRDLRSKGGAFILASEYFSFRDFLLTTQSRNLGRKHLLVFTRKSLTLEDINRGMAEGRIFVELTETPKGYDGILDAAPHQFTKHDVGHYAAEMQNAFSQMDLNLLESEQFMRGLLSRVDSMPTPAKQKRFHAIFSTIFREVTSFRFRERGLVEEFESRAEALGSLRRILRDNEIPVEGDKQIMRDLREFETIWDQAWEEAAKLK